MNQASKRLEYPNEKDYRIEYYLDRHLGYDRHCARNESGQILHVFESKEQADSQIDLLRIFAREMLNAHNDRIMFHKRNNPEIYKPTYEEANFVDKALIMGFKPNFDVKPYDNWFGVSAYCPDLVLIRGGKVITLSLQGSAMRIPKEDEMTPEILKLMQSVSCKYISFVNDGKYEYENFGGNLPSNEFVENFILK